MRLLRRTLLAVPPLLAVALAATASTTSAASNGAPVTAAAVASVAGDLARCPAGTLPVLTEPELCAAPASDPAIAALHAHEPGHVDAAATYGAPGQTKPRAIPCRGDGTTGNRIQIFYGYLAGKPNRVNAVRAHLADAVLRANAVVYESARQSGGSRQLRIVTDRNCKPVITPIKLPAAAGKSYNATVAAVKSKLKASNRKYVIFLDTNVICGQGSAWLDDRAGIGNANNAGPSYARIDAKCWNGPTVAHEIFHMLGAVQPSAPNSDGGLHCRDEWDLMCYKAAGAKRGKTTMYTRCAAKLNDERADCGKNDYFSTNPKRGSYLATHWNTASSSFLYGGGGARPAKPGNVPGLKLGAVTAKQVALTWTKAPGRVTQYEVRRDTKVIWRGTSTRFTDSKPLPGRHSYMVIATNESGSGPSWRGFNVTVPVR